MNWNDLTLGAPYEIGMPCEIDGCDAWGFPVGHSEVEHWYCPRHAHERGWCWHCGGFFGGVESFEWSDQRVCDDCEFIIEEINASEDGWE
jgi:hypothetical protein